jgi:glucosamine-6-phosphate deaminase
LQKLPNARFYLTEGAAIKLIERWYENVENLPELDTKTIEKAVFNMALAKNKKLSDLTLDDYNSDRFTKLILQRTNRSYKDISDSLRKSIKSRIERGMVNLDGETFMHTSPHHDDEMLGYLPYIVHLVRNPNNKHYFTYLTSGFNAVTNSYVLERMKNLRDLADHSSFQALMENNYFDPANTAARNRDVNLYLDGVALYDVKKQIEAESRRLLSILTEIYEESNIIYLKDRISELINYFATQYPGKKDIAHVQKLKGMIREWEADVLWGYFGFNSNNVFHLRLGFYKGDIFSEEPTINRDVLPIYRIMEKINRLFLP